MAIRAHSPSPIRKRGSLLDLFATPNEASMAMTHGDMISNQNCRPPPKPTAKEVDETYEGEIPNTVYGDLPPGFNEATELRKAEETLVNERIEFYLGFFYKEMNDTASKLGLKRTNFAVAHGMHHNDNYGTAFDIANLSRLALAKHSLLDEICNTKTYELRSRIRNSHTYKWRNTNDMLWNSEGPEGKFTGIKTGVTPTAGPCLAVCFKSYCGTYDFIIVVMNCKSKEARFVEIPKLVSWAIRRITKVKNSNLRPGIKKRLLRNMAHV